MAKFLDDTGAGRLISGLFAKVQGMLSNKLNKDFTSRVLWDIQPEFGNSSGVSLLLFYTDLPSGETGYTPVLLPQANTLAPGFMTISQVKQLNAATSNIATEIARATEAEALLVPRGIAQTLLTNATIEQDALGVNIDIAAVLPSDGTALTQRTVLPVASTTLAGLIPAESMAALAQAISDIESLRNLGGRRVGAFDTYAELQSYIFSENDRAGDWANVRADENEDGAATRYYATADEDGYLVWQFDMVYSSGATPYATQDTAGISKGVDAYGKIYYEDDHTASWVGATWVQETLANLQSALDTIVQQLGLKVDVSALKELAYRNTVASGQIDDAAVTPAKVQSTGAFTMGSLSVGTLNITG
jgi:hypothetical protein